MNIEASMGHNVELTCNVFDRVQKHEIEDLQIQLQQKDQEMSLMKENIEVRTV